MSPAAHRRPRRCRARSRLPTLADARPATLWPAACLGLSAFARLGNLFVRIVVDLPLAGARFARAPFAQRGPQRSFREKMFSHVVDEDSQFRRAMAARRPQGA